MAVAIGVDSHKSSLTAAAVDELGRPMGVKTFVNSHKGHLELMTWAARNDAVTIGVECSGSYGAALVRQLLTTTLNVVEVPPFLAHRETRVTPAKGKSDASDALAIARVVARGDGLSAPERIESWDNCRLLSEHRDQLVRRRTRLANRIHSDLVILCPGYERTIPNLVTKANLDRARLLVRRDRSLRADIVRDNLEEISRLDRRIADVTKRIADEVRTTGTSLTSLTGVSVVLAAKILGEIGDISRIRSKAAFAMFNGTAPLQASSGQTQRHRLNRRGRRHLNHALHLVAVVRRRCDDDTKEFIARRRLNGSTNKEAMRALKRHLSNLVYRTLVADARRLAGVESAA